jgi:uncharacterized surface protein with fasciclin (FAS1) repeats
VLQLIQVLEDGRRLWRVQVKQACEKNLVLSIWNAGRSRWEWELTPPDLDYHVVGGSADTAALALTDALVSLHELTGDQAHSFQEWCVSKFNSRQPHSF